ncbi:MAG: hypothetical protein VYD43_00500, partial [Actinomycetota bacterium]|nr:hypothetical protein [Actinomycetota bacterium]
CHLINITHEAMNDPFALNLTINLLLLGVGSAMFFGNLFAYVNKEKEGKEIYLSRTIFLGSVGLLIALWSGLSILNG